MTNAARLSRVDESSVTQGAGRLSVQNLFQSPRCALAREKERRLFAMRWQSVVTPMGANGGVRNLGNLALSHDLRAVYVYNPKAAHSSVLEMFKAASRSHVHEHVSIPYGTPGHSKLNRTVPPNYTIFTFIREPIGDFISGYAETVSRVTTLGGARSKRSAATSYTSVDCHLSNSNATRFAAFLHDLLACRQMGYDTYHIWPQVVKMDILSEFRMFDFIGRVESLQEDWAALMHRLGRSPRPMVTKNAAGHNVDSCGKVIAVPLEARQAALPLICDLLQADYECLGYPLPNGCSTAGHSRTDLAACSVAAGQSAVLDRVRMGDQAPVHSTQSRLGQLPDPAGGAIAPARCSSRSAAAGVALHTTGQSCFEVTRMKTGIPASSDRPYQTVNVPSELTGELFLRAPHRITSSLNLTLVFQPWVKETRVFVWWNSRSGLSGLRDVLQPRGFQLVGEGPGYFRPPATTSRSEMWVYRHTSTADAVTETSLRLQISPAPSEVAMGIVVACVCGEGATSSCTAQGQSAITAPVPSPIDHTSQTDTANVHISNIRRLSMQLHGNAPSKERLRLFAASLAPTEKELSRCGSVVVPFGGYMLAEFEDHLNTFGNPMSQTISWQNASNATGHIGRIHLNRNKDSAVKQLGDDVGVGNHHMVFPVDPADAKLLGVSEQSSLLIRTNIGVPDPTTRCDAYLGGVWNGWMAWILGEMGITPRVHAIWMEQANLTQGRRYTMFEADAAFRTVSVLTRWPSLEVALREKDSIPAAAAQLLHEQLLFMAQSGLVLFDIKPRDMYISRMPNDQWQVRLGDIEIAVWVTGMLLHVAVECRRLLTAQLPVVFFACGPLREHAMARSFVSQAYQALWLREGKEVDGSMSAKIESSGQNDARAPTLAHNWSSLVMKQCSSFENSHCGATQPNTGKRGDTWTGYLRGPTTMSLDEAKSNFLRTVRETRNTPIHAIMNAIVHGRGACPAKYQWGSFDQVHGKNMQADVAVGSG